MQTPETISSVYHERGKRRLPLERVYRQLFNPALYLAAYAKLSQNAGALTPGVTDETIDGMAMERIHAIIQALREERYEWKPARRLFIEKKDSTKKRPLVLPTWSDKLLQEVMRMLLDPYFEPQFSDRSHGFRPDRGCHTALQEIRGQWKGTVWFIEGDISQCFGSLNHEVLLSLLKETIHDGRFLGLLEQLLKAGSLEEWTRRSPLSGAPQGGVLSPLLANIYLDRLDQFVDQCLVPAYTGGETQKRNPAYLRLKDKARSLRKQGRYEEACRVRQEMQAMPSRDTHDSGYRRLRYIRYADDFLIGLTGPREEAEQIKERLRLFLSESLKLTLSEEKTVITHGTSEAARFLGYEVVVQRSDTRQDSRGHRTINGSIGLRVPNAVILARCAAYQRHGEPTTRPELLNDEVFSIVAHYQAEYRGVVEYYRLAVNVGWLARLKHVMEESLVRTLSAKLKISVRRIYRRFRTVLQTPDGPKGVLMVKVEREGKPPLRALWGNISLKRKTSAVLNDNPPKIWNTQSELIQRLLADVCEVCGSRERVQVHHVRRLAGLRRGGRSRGEQVMIARRRKTLIVCHGCHMDIHAGRPLHGTVKMGHRRAG